MLAAVSRTLSSLFITYLQNHTAAQFIQKLFKCTRVAHIYVPDTTEVTSVTVNYPQNSGSFDQDLAADNTVFCTSHRL